MQDQKPSDYKPKVIQTLSSFGWNISGLPSVFRYYRPYAQRSITSKYFLNDLQSILLSSVFYLSTQINEIENIIQEVLGFF